MFAFDHGETGLGGVDFWHCIFQSMYSFIFVVDGLITVWVSVSNTRTDVSVLIV
jgi:hypothetical protein